MRAREARGIDPPAAGIPRIEDRGGAELQLRLGPILPRWRCGTPRNRHRIIGGVEAVLVRRLEAPDHGFRRRTSSRRRPPRAARHPIGGRKSLALIARQARARFPAICASFAEIAARSRSAGVKTTAASGRSGARSSRPRSRSVRNRSRRRAGAGRAARQGVRSLLRHGAERGRQRRRAQDPQTDSDHPCGTHAPSSSASGIDRFAP